MLTRLWIVAAIVCAMLVRLTIDVAISVIDVVLNCSALSMAIIVMLVRLWVMTVTIIVVFVCPSVDTAIIVMMLIWLDTGMATIIIIRCCSAHRLGSQCGYHRDARWLLAR